MELKCTEERFYLVRVVRDINVHNTVQYSIEPCDAKSCLTDECNYYCLLLLNTSSKTIMWRHILNTPSPSSHIVTKCLTPPPWCVTSFMDGPLNDTRHNRYTLPPMTLWKSDLNLLWTTLWTTPLIFRSALNKLVSSSWLLSGAWLVWRLRYEFQILRSNQD